MTQRVVWGTCGVCGLPLRMLQNADRPNTYDYLDALCDCFIEQHEKKETPA